jgi:hypothetical protein
MDPSDNQTDVSYSLTLTPSEIGLIRTALELLEDTLGREEADELGEVQDLLRRLPHAHAAG